MSTPQDQHEERDQRGYGGAEDDVNAETPPQAQQRPEHESSDGDDATADELTERGRTETESGPGRGAE